MATRHRRTSGSVRQRESGRWQARVRDPVTNRMVSLGMFPTKGDADIALALAAADQTRGAWIDPARGKATLAEYAGAWLANHPTLRPRTRRLYSDLLRLHIVPTLGETELGRLTPAAVRAWHSTLRAGERPGASTVAKAYRLLHAVLAGAVADERIVRNPCTIRGASTERAGERPVASVAQVYALADAVEPRFRALVLMAAFTGLRRGELLALTRERIDFLHQTVAVVEQRHDLPDGSLLLAPPKTDAGRRVIALPPPLVIELERHLSEYVAAEAGALVFTGEKGGPLRVHVWQAHWDRARRALGLEQLHFHDLRHVANTLAAASGATTKELMYRMGHASPAAALRYQHATRDRDAVIAAALGQLMTTDRAAVTPLRVPGATPVR
jgi:integrase